MSAALFNACKSGNLDECRLVLSQSPPLINAIIDSTNKGTALRTAARWNHPNIVKFLLQFPNILVNKQDKHGETALHRASHLGNEEIVMLIVSNPQADISIKNNANETAMDIAASDTIRNLIMHPMKGSNSTRDLNEIDPPSFKCPKGLATTDCNTTSLPKREVTAADNPSTDTTRNGKTYPPEVLNSTNKKIETPPPALSYATAPKTARSLSPLAHVTSSMKHDPAAASPDGDMYCFLSHNWGYDELERDNHARVAMIARELNQRGIKTWLDEDEMTGNIRSTMAKAIKRSRIVLVFITLKYSQKIDRNTNEDNCFYELSWASQCHSDDLVPVVMEPIMKNQKLWCDRLRAELGGLKYVDCSDGNINVEELVLEIQRKLMRKA